MLYSQVFTGPSDLLEMIKPFVPTPTDIQNVSLPQYALDLHERLAENMHELWAMHKIENGWTYGEVCL